MNRHVPWDFDPLSLFLVDKIPSVLVMFPEFKCQLVGGLEHAFYFSIYIGNAIIPTDEVKFFRAVQTSQCLMMLDGYEIT